METRLFSTKKREGSAEKQRIRRSTVDGRRKHEEESKNQRRSKKIEQLLMEDEIQMLNKKLITIQKKMHGLLQKYEKINVDIVISDEIAEEAKEKDFENLSTEDTEEEEVLSTSSRRLE